MAAIRQAVVDGHADALMKAAHALKGSCRNIRALPLGELSFSLEEKGRARETDNVEVLCNELEQEYSRVHIALGVELSKSTASFTS